MLISFRDKITSKYDVIVIGSGLAGMTAANKLARNGRRVLLLEAHNKLGGLATWFKRATGDHIFDISLHGFPVGMIKTCKKYWGREIAESIVQLRSLRYVNPQFEIETDYTEDGFKKILQQRFGIASELAEGFFNKLKQMNFYDDQSLSTGELFERFFPGRNDVVRFLMEPITYANGSTLEDPAITYGIVFSNFMSKGIYTFQGGTDVLIGKMKDELLKNGVDIKFHSKVDKIIVRDKRACGVMIKGQEIYADSVLSNGNLLATVENLVGTQEFTEKFLQKARQVRLNTSSCQVYMGIRKGESIPHIGDLLFYSQDEQFRTENLLSKEIRSQTFSFYYPEIRPQLDQRYAIVSSSNARYQDWNGLSEEQYQVQKNFIIERALTVLEKFLPEIRQKIDYIEAATPKTIERYTHHCQGASFGTKFEGLDVSMNLHKEIAGLFHAGSVGIIMSGWLGAANYGVIQSHEIENYLDARL